MLQLLKYIYSIFKSKLPKNKLRAEHNSMVLRLKELELQVCESAKQLETAKTSFLKNVFHEIRTPLNSIVGFINLLNRDNLLSELDKEKYRSIINKSSADFLHVMDDLIEASLLEAGMIKLDVEVCNLGDFMEESHNFYSVRKHIVEKSSIVLLQTMQDEYKGADVLIDKYRVTQILTQLIDYAFKFTEKGTVEYGLTIKHGLIEFFVKNNNTFIEQENQDIIFSRFSKVDETNESKDGMGLGLSICKDIVELMGGEIWYTSDAKNGTAFHFNLPYVAAELTDKQLESKKGLNKPSHILVPSDENYLAV